MTRIPVRSDVAPMLPRRDPVQFDPFNLLEDRDTIGFATANRDKRSLYLLGRGRTSAFGTGENFFARGKINKLTGGGYFDDTRIANALAESSKGMSVNQLLFGLKAPFLFAADLFNPADRPFEGVVQEDFDARQAFDMLDSPTKFVLVQQGKVPDHYKSMKNQAAFDTAVAIDMEMARASASLAQWEQQSGFIPKLGSTVTSFVQNDILSDPVNLALIPISGGGYTLMAKGAQTALWLRGAVTAEGIVVGAWYPIGHQLSYNELQTKYENLDDRQLTGIEVIGSTLAGGLLGYFLGGLGASRTAARMNQDLIESASDQGTTFIRSMNPAEIEAAEAIETLQSRVKDKIAAVYGDNAGILTNLTTEQGWKFYNIDPDSLIQFLDRNPTIQEVNTVLQKSREKRIPKLKQTEYERLRTRVQTLENRIFEADADEATRLLPRLDAARDDLTLLMAELKGLKTTRDIQDVIGPLELKARLTKKEASDNFNLLIDGLREHMPRVGATQFNLINRFFHRLPGGAFIANKVNDVVGSFNSLNKATYGDNEILQSIASIITNDIPTGRAVANHLQIPIPSISAVRSRSMAKSNRFQTEWSSILDQTDMDNTMLSRAAIRHVRGVEVSTDPTVIAAARLTRDFFEEYGTKGARVGMFDAARMKDYIPSMWNTRAIQRNITGFITDFKNALMNKWRNSDELLDGALEEMGLITITRNRMGRKEAVEITLEGERAGLTGTKFTRNMLKGKAKDNYEAALDTTLTATAELTGNTLGVHGYVRDPNKKFKNTVSSFVRSRSQVIDDDIRFAPEMDKWQNWDLLEGVSDYSERSGTIILSMHDVEAEAFGGFFMEDALTRLRNNISEFVGEDATSIQRTQYTRALDGIDFAYQNLLGISTTEAESTLFGNLSRSAINLTRALFAPLWVTATTAEMLRGWVFSVQNRGPFMGAVRGFLDIIDSIPTNQRRAVLEDYGQGHATYRNHGRRMLSGDEHLGRGQPSTVRHTVEDWRDLGQRTTVSEAAESTTRSIADLNLRFSGMSRFSEMWRSGVAKSAQAGLGRYATNMRQLRTLLDQSNINEILDPRARFKAFKGIARKAGIPLDLAWTMNMKGLLARDFIEGLNLAERTVGRNLLGKELVDFDGFVEAMSALPASQRPVVQKTMNAMKDYIEHWMDTIVVTPGARQASSLLSSSPIAQMFAALTSYSRTFYDRNIATWGGYPLHRMMPALSAYTMGEMFYLMSRRVIRGDSIEEIRAEWEENPGRTFSRYTLNVPYFGMFTHQVLGLYRAMAEGTPMPGFLDSATNAAFGQMWNSGRGLVNRLTTGEPLQANDVLLARLFPGLGHWAAQFFINQSLSSEPVAGKAKIPSPVEMQDINHMQRTLQNNGSVLDVISQPDASDFPIVRTDAEKKSDEEAQKLITDFVEGISNNE